MTTLRADDLHGLSMQFPPDTPVMVRLPDGSLYHVTEVTMVRSVLPRGNDVPMARLELNATPVREAR